MGQPEACGPRARLPEVVLSAHRIDATRGSDGPARLEIQLGKRRCDDTRSVGGQRISTITLDQAPTSPINGANFVVTLGACGSARQHSATASALASASAASEALPSTILRGITIVDAKITVSSATLSWQLPYLQANAAQRITILFLDELLSFGAPARWFARARVRLLGRAIFSGSGASQLFLDGQSFGQSATRADGKTPRIDLQLPSGNGEKASDFEGWFYVAPTLLLVSVAVNYPALTVVVELQQRSDGCAGYSGGWHYAPNRHSPRQRSR